MGFQIVFTLNCHCHSKIILLSVAINNFKLSLVSELKGKILKRLWLKVSFFFCQNLFYIHTGLKLQFFFHDFLILNNCSGEACINCNLLSQ